MTSIVPACAGDVAAIHRLDRTHSHVFNNATSYERFIDAPAGLLLVCRQGERVVGFAAFSMVIDEATLLNLVVDPGFRRDGNARELMTVALHELRASALRRVLLELRESNDAAMALYASLGFSVDGRRPGYYPAQTPGAVHTSCGREAAVLMSLDLETSHACA
ncbi:MAG: hypothetical protein Cons2KO_22550 [Congregibacter sp.]